MIILWLLRCASRNLLCWFLVTLSINFSRMCTLWCNSRALPTSPKNMLLVRNSLAISTLLSAGRLYALVQNAKKKQLYYSLTNIFFNRPCAFKSLLKIHVLFERICGSSLIIHSLKYEIGSLFYVLIDISLFFFNTLFNTMFKVFIGSIITSGIFTCHSIVRPFHNYLAQYDQWLPLHSAKINVQVGWAWESRPSTFNIHFAGIE